MSLEPAIKEKKFKSEESVAEALADLIIRHISKNVNHHYGVMLSGGHTPLAGYDRVAKSGVRAGKNVYILFSDERMVPADSADSNYRNARRMIKAIGAPPERVLRVQTDKSLTNAAEQYDRDLAEFFDADGQIGLALLGLGADGHTASLFSIADVIRGGDRWAMAVVREDFERVTVTARLIRSAKNVIMVATGPEKIFMIQRLLDSPASFPAGLAIAGARSIELWHAP